MIILINLVGFWVEKDFEVVFRFNGEDVVSIGDFWYGYERKGCVRLFLFLFWVWRGLFFFERG